MKKILMSYVPAYFVCFMSGIGAGCIIRNANSKKMKALGWILGIADVIGSFFVGAMAYDEYDKLETEEDVMDSLKDRING